jgi:predicted nucleotidyltransferase
MTETPEFPNTLVGVVGSTAYGLAHAGSDVDRAGVYAAPSSTFLGLHPPVEARFTTQLYDPDIVMHEIGKYLRLAIKGNPSVLEVLWLPRSTGYEMITGYGDELRALRGDLLSGPHIRAAYLGFADSLLQRLKRGMVPEHRRAKHGRHLARIMFQVSGLHRSGGLTVQLAETDREDAFAIGDLCAAGKTDRAEQLIAGTATLLNTPGALPAHADEPKVNDWLLSVRRRLMREEGNF